MILPQHIVQHDANKGPVPLGLHMAKLHMLLGANI